VSNQELLAGGAGATEGRRWGGGNAIRGRKMAVRPARTGGNGQRSKQGFQGSVKGVGIFKADDFLAKNPLAVVEHGRR
jgi:hypothetical protein